MSDEITPTRLDALLDGSATPETDDEREMLHLAARMRDGSPHAPDALRRRVQALEPAAEATAGPRKRRWLPATSRGWLMLGAPALSAQANEMLREEDATERAQRILDSVED